MGRCVNRWHGGTIGRHSLSFAALSSSLREGAGNGCGGAYHSAYRPETATLRAIFIAPTKLKSFYISPFIGGHSLSQPLRAASSLREGAGNELYHSMCRPETATLRAIFIAPTKLKSFYISPFTISKHTIFLKKRKEKFL